MRVNFARAAEADLEALETWIAEDDPRRAISFLIELRGRCLSLGDRPRRFPIVVRRRGYIVRKLSYKDYLIFYVIRG